MIPFEFTIEGPPVSLQSKNAARRAAWKRRVANAAIAKLPAGAAPVTDNVSVKITYFFEQEAPDVDNIIKPIQDALVGIVYVDDAQVTDTSSRKSDINGAFRVRYLPPDLAMRFAAGKEFLRIQILPDPDHEVLV